MNNRIPRNKRGKISRNRFAQFAPETEVIREGKELVENPNFPGVRRIVHQLIPKYITGLWGMK